ncbi:MAG: 3-isopropylmalate dehydratase small subunit [Caldisphaera sp.]|jgi:3-isopropylmalate/(R)-2-methylmalate dehydratase small subunit|nr:MAG: 3-isopropylmalate dehydratase small subunit [Caldisphaera sp.]
MIIKGFIHVLGDNIDTDVIIPGRYLMITEPNEVAKHLFEGVEPEFIKRVKANDVLIAGKNFGSGSSREQAASGIKAIGIGAIIAKSYARIFFRNAINIGLPIFTSNEIYDYVKEKIKNLPFSGSFIKSTNIFISIDANNGIVEIEDKKFKINPLPEFIQEIVKNNDLIGWAKSRLKNRI